MGSPITKGVALAMALGLFMALVPQAVATEMSEDGQRVVTEAFSGQEQARLALWTFLVHKAQRGDKAAAQALFNIVVRLAAGENPDEIFNSTETDGEEVASEASDTLDEEVPQALANF